MLPEYGEVIRIYVTTDHGIGPGYGSVFVSEQKPLAARLYCREMTLARGRILYEVWDAHNAVILGYIVPEEILAEAKAYRPSSALTPWPDEGSQTRNILQRHHDTILLQFPRMPPTSAKSIAEAYQARGRYRASSRRALEYCVIEHVRLKWTSYEFRVHKVKQDEKEVLELIKPRMREVLKGWLPRVHEASFRGRDETATLFERHGLGNEDEMRIVVEDGEAAVRWARLRYAGGLETVANLEVPGI